MGAHRVTIMRIRKGLRKRKIAHSQNNSCLNDDVAKKKLSPLAENLGKIERERFSSNRSEMARLVGVSPSTMKRWIEGDMVPGSNALNKIAKGLGVSLQDVLGPSALVASTDGARGEIVNPAQAAAVDWLISQGEDPDAVASAATIILTRTEGAAERPRIWWVAQISKLLHELG